MKRILSCIALVGLIALLSSCGGDSPSTKPVPTVVPDSWTITLESSNPSPNVDSYVWLTATVTKTGEPVEDGTIVYFSGGDPNCTGIPWTAEVQTTDGEASTYHTNCTSGNFSYVARAHNISASQVVAWQPYDGSNYLKILQALPNEGAFDGGEQVILKGQGISAPVEVNFLVGSTLLAAEVISVNESDPLSAEGSIILRTPYVGGADRTIGTPIDIVVTGGKDTLFEQVYTYRGGFTYLAEQALQIYQPLELNYGSYEGGDTVTLRGIGIQAPARVTFTFDSDGGTVSFPAIIRSIVESVPLTAEGSITIETPYVPEGDRVYVEDPELGNLLQPAYADVLVEVGIDQPDPSTEDLVRAWTYTPTDDTVPEVWRLKQPAAIYLVIEDHGPSAGGETVTILGRDFRAFKYGTDGVTIVDSAPAVSSVTFDTSLDLEAQILSVSEDGTQIQVITPRFSVLPLLEGKLVDVMVTTEFAYAEAEPDTVTLKEGYLYQADQPTPEITALSPVAGPIDGGNLVTIFGHGFQFPVQVFFGTNTATGETVAAEVISLDDDQTLADNDIITCLAPDFSQFATPPVAVGVRVVNVETGLTSEEVIYTYGDEMYVIDNNPKSGRAGDPVIIYGAGFVAPLLVEYSNPPAPWDGRLDVLSVSGTEIVVKFPDELAGSCAMANGSFHVTNIDNGNEATGGGFELLGNTPLVISVTPLFVQSFNNGADVLPSEVTIYGSDFADDLWVSVDGFRMANADITVVDSTTIEVINLPSPNDFGLSFDQTTCFTDLGLQGIREVPTTVDVSVTNFPGECTDTLRGALIYEPESTDCVVGPEIGTTPTSLIFPDAPAPAPPNCTNAQLVITNSGAGTLVVDSITLVGRFFFLGTLNQSMVPGPSIQPFGTSTIDLRFCPDVDNGFAYTGQAVILSNDPDDSPYFINLSGQELQEPIIATAPFADGDTWTFPTTAAGMASATENLTITNVGDGDMAISSVATTAPFTIVAAPTLTLAAGASTVVGIQFQPTVDDNMLQTSTLVINSDSVNLPSVVINLEGQEQP